MAVVKMSIGMKKEACKAISSALGTVLSNTYILYLKTQNFHWNVKGSDFVSLHSLFESQYQDLAKANDEIAERIRALGYPAPGSFAEFIQQATIKEAKGTYKAAQMIKTLLEDQEIMIEALQTAMIPADKANDQPTVDLLTERLATHEKAAWMLRSLLA